MAVRRVKRLAASGGNQAISMGCIFTHHARWNMWIANVGAEKLSPAQLLGL